jgi:hypothetical protein
MTLERYADEGVIPRAAISLSLTELLAIMDCPPIGGVIPPHGHRRIPPVVHGIRQSPYACQPEHTHRFRGPPVPLPASLGNYF